MVREVLSAHKGRLSRLTLAVPKPRPGVFRSTKDMHNILQGVNKPGQRLSDEDRNAITDWITHNAESYWLSEGGPLRPVDEGGAHIVVVRRKKSLMNQRSPYLGLSK